MKQKRSSVEGGLRFSVTRHAQAKEGADPGLVGKPCQKWKSVEGGLRLSATRIQHPAITDQVMKPDQKPEMPLKVGVGVGVPPPPRTHGAQQAGHAI